MNANADATSNVDLAAAETILNRARDELHALGMTVNVNVSLNK